MKPESLVPGFYIFQLINDFQQVIIHAAHAMFFSLD